VLFGLVALLVAAAPAAAGPVTSTGSLVVRWHSNPATCAEHGLCGRSGTLSWRPEDQGGTADIVQGDFGFVSFIGPDAIARSYRGNTGSCIDHSSAPVDVTGEPGPRKGQFVFSMRGSDALSFGRCAGPLASDFMAALPQSPPVDTAKLRSRAVIDLRSRAAFSSGPFEGEVVSTLVVRTRPEPPQESGNSFSGTFSPKTTRGRRVHYGIVTAAYAIEGLQGDAGYAFSGAPEAECSPFDTCGMSGEVMLHADVRIGRLTVTTVRPIPERARETTAGGLRAMRHGGTSVFGDSFVGPIDESDTQPPFGIPFTETATPGEGEQCSDSGSFREPDLSVRRAQAGLLLRMNHGGNSDPDPLRTRCPGPGSDDVGALVSGVLPLAAVGQQSVTVPLRPSPFVTMVGLRGAGRGELQLTLRLQSLRAITRTQRLTREEGL
jgi:hypothetical protein